MSNVTPLHKHLECRVTSCFTCPFRHVHEVVIGLHTQHVCHASRTVETRRVFEIDDDGKHPPPEWCPLRLQPIHVKLSKEIAP